MLNKLRILWAFAIFVLVVGWAITPAQAHDCSRHDDKTHKHCLVVESEEAIPVQVTFRDAIGDSMQSDWADIVGCGQSNCPYIDGVDGVGATMPVPRSSGGATEFANRFIMTTLNNPFLRRLVINFGNAVNCETGLPEDEGACVNDATSIPAAPNPVECPFPVIQRGDENVCRAPAPAVLNLRDVDVTADNTFGKLITVMPIGGPFEVRNRAREVQFLVPKKPGSRGNVTWNIEFEPLTEFCPAGVAEFLDVVATSDDETNTVGDAERWDIGTDSGVKSACLIKGNNQKSVFVGVFDMAFEYEICILGSTTCP